MDGIGLFHFRTEYRAIIRFCEELHGEHSLLIVILWNSTRDIAYTRARKLKRLVLLEILLYVSIVSI